MVIDRSSEVWAWEWRNKSEVFGDWIPNADPQDDGVVFELGLRFPGQQVTRASGSIKPSRATLPLTPLRISWQIASDDHLDK
ncbi:hypothetical protein [Stenotrophomonas sp. WZN-1]|uniref:hypothetical protein n=1 Tax=Stenotrophomonas sp. WZN-1 TaxID=2005046 RepID=UPI001E580A9E|nr:hypothetical protein [Stenotrophomonas sp. WZN-1]